MIKWSTGASIAGLQIHFSLKVKGKESREKSNWDAVAVFGSRQMADSRSR